MTEPTQIPVEDVKIDVANLYHEDTFTDMRVGSLRRLTPVTAQGERDLSRPVLFLAQTQLMSQYGPVPVQAEIEAGTLEEAIAEFPQAVGKAVDQLMDEVREARRQEMSRIVVPGADTANKILQK